MQGRRQEPKDKGPAGNSHAEQGVSWDMFTRAGWTELEGGAFLLADMPAKEGEASTLEAEREFLQGGFQCLYCSVPQRMTAGTLHIFRWEKIWDEPKRYFYELLFHSIGALWEFLTCSL